MADGTVPILELGEGLVQGDVHRLGRLSTTIVEIVQFVHTGLGALGGFGGQVTRVILESVLVVEGDIV